jgi:hypothetical protein
MMASTLARSFLGRQLRIAISRRTSVGDKRGGDLCQRFGRCRANGRLGVEQEQNRSRKRIGHAAQREAGDECAARFDGQGVSDLKKRTDQFERIAAACFKEP